MSASRRAPERSFLSMALEAPEKALIERAAEMSDLAPSVWGRSTLLREARKLLGEEKVLTK
jgi:hypothetical protein